MTSLAARSLVLLVSLITAGVSLLVAPPASSQQATAGWRAISAGELHSCGIRTTGRLYCWGDNASGQLGDGSKGGTADIPVQVAGNRTDWKAVSTGSLHTCALRTSGRLFCWGSSSAGRLGTGGGDVSVPTQVAGNRTDWMAPTAGQEHTCALRSSRRLFCWGYNAYGQLGDGTEEDRATPRQVKGGWTNWTQVSAGVSHTCARRATGRAYCWGAGGDGQIGDGGESNRTAPTQVAGNRTDWASMAAGYYHSCGRRTTGRLFCWGDNPSGQLGIGTTGDQRLTPAQVAGSRTDWVAVSTSVEHTCARRSSGRLFCWGNNNDGQVGNGFKIDAGSPTQVSGMSTEWRGVSAGGTHTCAVTSGLRAYCWGRNLNGQLGDDSATERLTPTEVFWP